MIYVLAIFLTAGFVGCSKSVVEDSSNVQTVSACQTAWGQIVTEGNKIAGYLADTARCGSECEPLEFTCESGKFKQISGEPIGEDQKVFPTCTKETRCSCEISGGGVVSDGVQVELYTAAFVACGSSCESVKTRAICQNGNFISTVSTQPVTGSTYSSCNMARCASCRAPWDQRVEYSHDQVVTGFIQNSLGCQENCESSANAVQIRCQNGSWTKVTSQNVAIADLKGTCSVRTRCNCTSANGTTYLHRPNESFTMYSRATGTCATMCGAGATYSCKNGDFHNASDQIVKASTLYSACTETCLFCDTAQIDNVTGQPIKLAAGSNRTLFRAASVSCGESCLSASVRCSTDGKISASSGVNPMAYAYSSCSVAACTSCTAPWDAGQSILNNNTVTRYLSSSAGCGSSCESVKVVAKCQNSQLQILSGPAGTTAASLSTSVASCSQSVCATCTLGGKTYNSGESVAAYSQNTVACGQSCTDPAIYTTRQCVNGSFTGSASYQYNSCTSSCLPPNPENVTTRTGDSSFESGGAAEYLCPLLGGKSFVLPSTQVTYYTRASVGCNQTCETYRKVLTCNGISGLLGDPSTNHYKGTLEPVYFKCAEKCP